ncbi:transposase, partial [Enterococcus faecium]|uniref:transposase n=1 Tax=Enterococcus faecium TaxID=1352 RepID=UPI0012AC7D1A
QQSYSNGPLECLNNHIKVLKRNAYGFRSFYNGSILFDVGELHQHLFCIKKI